MKNMRKFIITSVLCLCAIVSASAQTKTITGNVTGSDGEILTGATLVTGGGQLCTL